MRVEDLTKFEEECPTIVVFNTYMDIRVPLTKKWKKIINERGDKPNTYSGQWLIVTDATGDRWVKCEELRFGGGACITWRKATVDEIVEHFKNR